MLLSSGFINLIIIYFKYLALVFNRKWIEEKLMKDNK